MADADNTAPDGSAAPDVPSTKAQAAGDTQPEGEAQPAGEARPAGEAQAKARGAARARAKAEPTAEPAKAEPAKAPAKPRARPKAAQDAATAADEDPQEQAPAADVGEPAATESAPDVSAARAGLKLHHLRPAPGARRAKNRVGRGEASKGKTAGRGTKGTKARDTVPARFEGGQMPLHRRVPKLKGFSNARFTTTYQVVNLDRLAALYPDGGDVTPDDLVARGAVRKGELVKVLGTGDVGTALRVTAHAFSASAKEKITSAGGTVTEL